MNLLTKSVQDISFDDVVAFCEQKVIEGVYLDYKKDKPRELAKHIAAFSNTLGGLIIIGAEEDDKTGVPKKWEGIEDSKHVEWVHQMANNVTPLPSYDVAITNSRDGKSFVLIRIFEGPAAPYVTVSDPTIWVRTGNVRTALIPANREDVLQLVNKSCRAAQHREEVRATMLSHFEHLSARQLNNPNTARSEPTHDILIHTCLMPYSPSKQLFRPQQALGGNMESFIGSSESLFSLSTEADPIPNGLGCVRYGYHGDVTAFQIYGNGAFLAITDIGEHDPKMDERAAYLVNAVRYLARDLHAARQLYTQTRYQGSIAGEVAIELHNGTPVRKLRNQGTIDLGLTPRALLDQYTWPIELDTLKLDDEQALNNYIVELGTHIHWDLGIADRDISEQIRTWLNKQNPDRF